MKKLTAPIGLGFLDFMAVVLISASLILVISVLIKRAQYENGAKNTKTKIHCESQIN